MMTALIAGERNPKVLAQIARSSLKNKITELEEAFTGHFDEHHRFLLGRMLARIDSIDPNIAAIDDQIETHLIPLAWAVERMDEIPGIGPTAAATALAEIGIDMSGFPTAGHLCSWAKVLPGHQLLRRQGQRRLLDRTRQPLPRPRPGRSRRHRRQDRYLRGRTLPTTRQTAGQEARHSRRRTIHPRHHLAPPARPGRPVPRRPPGPLQPPHHPDTRKTQPRPPARSPRLHRHPGPSRLTSSSHHLMGAWNVRNGPTRGTSSMATAAARQAAPPPAETGRRMNFGSCAAGRPATVCRVRSKCLVRVIPSPSTGSTFLASFPNLIAVYARKQHQDRTDQDDKKHKHQSNRFLAVHTAILCPEGHQGAGDQMLLSQSYTSSSTGLGSGRGGRVFDGAPASALV